MEKYNQHAKCAVLFILPQLIVTVLFFIWPACKAIIQSMLFSDAFGLHQQFAGLTNFIDVFSQWEYLNAVIVTMIMALFITVITMGFGLVAAVLVQNCMKRQRLYKSLLLWPYAIAPVIAAILWRFLCHPTLGWITRMLKFIGIDFNYLIHPKQALIVVILAASWQQFSYNFLFFLAALKLVPSALIDASIIDGASSWQRFWHVIFPLLSPTAFFLLTMNVIYSFFDTFGIIQVMTQGGPEYSTTTLVYKVYQDGFVGMDPGSSSAQSVILMLMVIGLTWLQFRYLEKKVHYQ